jgi:hypothetical protein
MINAELRIALVVRLRLGVIRHFPHCFSIFTHPGKIPFTPIR